MTVVSGDGSPVGEVKDVIFDRQGRATHLVISSSADGKLTAMPWDAALAIIKDGKLVLDGAKLQGAPSFRPDAWPNLDDPHWSAKADAYWRKAVRAAIAAHPGNPIDSIARQRGRRTRGSDGDGN
ncbi:MAG TPA: PRC-barrel domain-containing protein [Steroidobacteraceae bacterium]